MKSEFHDGCTVFMIKQSLKACHKLCVIYIIFSPDPNKEIHKLCVIYIIFTPDPNKEIWDSTEGDWGLK